MHNTQNIDEVGASLVELMGFFSSPQRLELLLREAAINLDRALVALIVCLARRGPLSVAGLSEQIGRDHTTISRQLAKLERLDLAARQAGGDRRVRTVSLTPAGDVVAAAITAARRRLLSRALAEWSAADLGALSALNRRFVDALTTAAQAPR